MACAPNSVTKRPILGRARRNPGRSRSCPWYQPKYRWLSVPSRSGGWGITPECAMTGRVPSPCSRARFTERSRTVLFQVGSCCAARARTAMRTHGVAVAPHLGVVLDGHRLVVAAPDGDRRVVAEQLDGGVGLAHGLLADATGVAPLQGEVLPEQEAPLVGRVVELGSGDVGVDAEEVEPGVEGQIDVAGQLCRGGLGQRHAGRPLVRALEEEALAVDRRDPAPHPDLAQAGAQPSLVGGGAAVVGGEVDPHRQVVQRGCAEGARPPQRGPVDGDRPLDLVRPVGQRTGRPRGRARPTS